MRSESDHTRLVLLEQDMKELSRQLAMNTSATLDLVEAWQSAKAMIAFVFLMSKIAVAVGICYAAIKGLIHIGGAQK